MSKDHTPLPAPLSSSRMSKKTEDSQQPWSISQYFLWTFGSILAGGLFITVAAISLTAIASGIGLVFTLAGAVFSAIVGAATLAAFALLSAAGLLATLTGNIILASASAIACPASQEPSTNPSVPSVPSVLACEPCAAKFFEPPETPVGFGAFQNCAVKTAWLLHPAGETSDVNFAVDKDNDVVVDYKMRFACPSITPDEALSAGIAKLVQGAHDDYRVSVWVAKALPDGTAK